MAQLVSLSLPRRGVPVVAARLRRYDLLGGQCPDAPVHSPGCLRMMCYHNGWHLDEEWLSSVAHVEQGAAVWMGRQGGQDVGIERRYPGVEQVLLPHYCAELRPGAAIELELLLRCCVELRPGAAAERRKLLMLWVFQARSWPEHELEMLCCR